MRSFEKLGAFYLGKAYDLGQRAVQDELLLYDSKDLTTHAVCVGMTGSGKTGLCLSLLEEAAIDGIPAIAIDPKGDLGNLALSFPQLDAASFQPWIDESQAIREGLTVEQYAAETARRWQAGLAEWGQDGQRVARFRESVDLVIYTPGSNAGLPLSVLRSFAAPGAAVLVDEDALAERVQSAASGLLALLGMDADPVRSREHILLSNLLDRAWREGRDLDLARLIQEIQRPPFDKLGVLDLETFLPSSDRLGMAMRLNNLLASPAFASWLSGEPLDVQRLLYTPEGKPKLSIISIAHLSDAERMFIVTLILNETLAWMRGQAGTSSLRALLYMDEVFGYFPPTAQPPAKKPMLTLLKQARAFGLGVVLATQNPVDLDYRGLANIGTWFLGRLQTERDKARILEGLEGAAAGSRQGFNRQQMEQTLAGLGSRVFLMHNVHEDEPVVFHTRWVLSYLRGPLTRAQIKSLMSARRSVAEDTVSTTKPAAAERAAETTIAEPPLLPAGVSQYFVQPEQIPATRSRLVYRPALYATSKLHFVRASYGVDVWDERTAVCLINRSTARSPWQQATLLNQRSAWDAEAAADFSFAATPAELTRKQSFQQWRQQLKTYLYQTQTLSVWKCSKLKLYSTAGETEGDFRTRLAQRCKEQRDLQIEKLRKRYSSRLATLGDRIRAAEQAVSRETEQFQRASFNSAVRIGSSLIGALFGRKLMSRTNVGRAASSARSLTSAAGQRGDIGRAQDKLEAYQKRLQELETAFESDVDQLELEYDAHSLELEALELRPRKADIQVQPIDILWTPWQVDGNGLAEPLFVWRTGN